MKKKQTLENLDQEFWNSKYENNLTGWDLGMVSPPIKGYVDQLEDKNLRILIPGAGNAYEAEYLIENGFKDITVIDIAPRLIQNLKKKFEGDSAIQLIHGDFFEHEGEYDLIIEQTFFCAIHPLLRPKYVEKMKTLLSEDGKLCGLLFNRKFEGGPPFEGNKQEYEELMKDDLHIKIIEKCYNSHPARKDTELWIQLQKY
ncbi:SAM-dependent methyltransferase [Brumimicrobium salinarum]|uniref:SAM-dependent methyltransferase n=1 Tax=Brumimicrobium salinarum TaxID=2058658 RepID=A0A2I0R2W6_9FLAO|nr:methyltransferase domain-containing protein [Brumimicrobium salinarum]PKR80923.1 SAM-dependent methyltransferase [Brumimicrobium salinarum]